MLSLINWIVVIVGALINMAIGSLWYSKYGFGTPWMKLVGITPESMKHTDKKVMMRSYAIMAFASLVMSYVLNVFIRVLGAYTFAQGVEVGFLLWLGFTAPTMIGEYAFLQRSKKLYWINACYYLLSLIIIGGVFAIW